MSTGKIVTQPIQVCTKKTLIKYTTLLPTDINDCLGVSCNSGSCVDTVNGFMCNCTAGFTGQHCETGIKEVIKENTPDYTT